MRLAVVGCGHIGGSLALALKAAGVVERVVGVERDEAHAVRALALGVIDARVASVGEAVAEVGAGGVVIVATPVRAMAGVLAEVAAAGGDAVVSDVGSLKDEVVRVGELVLGERFVGAHPMAGTEKSGPEAAQVGLFAGKTVIVTPGAKSAVAAVARVEGLWQAVGARVVKMAPDAHDAAMAALSHLPHVAAYALAGVFSGHEAWAGLSGGSLASGTRVAASDPAMWSALMVANQAALLPWVERFEAEVAKLKAAIAAGDEAELRRVLSEARAARAAVVKE